MPTEIDELRALVREQGERIHALETRLGSRATTTETASEPTRRQLFRLAGAAAAGGVAASLGGAGLAAPPAGAADGDSLLLGEENVAESVTSLSLTKTTDAPLAGTALTVTAEGLEADGYLMAVAGEADLTDVTSPSPAIHNTVGVGGLAREGMGVRGEGVYGVVGEGTAVGLVGGGPIAASVRGEVADIFLYDGPRVRDDTWGHGRGQIWRDAPGAVWLCVEPGAAGQTGAWQKLGGPATAGQLHLTAPTRIYDSRAGQVPLDVTKGKLANGAERVVDAKHGGAVPASENGGTPMAALVNLTITDTTSTGGYLALFENGTTWPGNSSINWDAVGRAVANTTVVPLDDQGRFKVRASPGGGTDFVIDVLGYWL